MGEIRDATHARKRPVILGVGNDRPERERSRETTPWRQFIEATLGALIVMVVGLTVKEFGFSIAWSFATAGFIGVLGVEWARQLGKRWAERKADEI